MTIRRYIKGGFFTLSESTLIWPERWLGENFLFFRSFFLLDPHCGQLSISLSQTSSSFSFIIMITQLRDHNHCGWLERVMVVMIKCRWTSLELLHRRIKVTPTHASIHHQDEDQHHQKDEDHHHHYHYQKLTSRRHWGANWGWGRGREGRSLWSDWQPGHYYYYCDYRDDQCDYDYHDWSWSSLSLLLWLSWWSYWRW